MSVPDRSREFQELFDHLELCGAHVREGGRQLLLALEELLKVVNHTLTIAGKESPLVRSITVAIVFLGGVVERVTQRIPALWEERELLELRIDTLAILRDLLRGELLRLDSKADPVRKDSILLALGYIDQEIERWAEKLKEIEVKGGEQEGYTAIPVEEIPTT